MANEIAYGVLIEEILIEIHKNKNTRIGLQISGENEPVVVTSSFNGIAANDIIMSLNGKSIQGAPKLAKKIFEMQYGIVKLLRPVL